MLSMRKNRNDPFPRVQIDRKNRRRDRVFRSVTKFKKKGPLQELLTPFQRAYVSKTNTREGDCISMDHHGSVSCMLIHSAAYDHTIRDASLGKL